MDCLLTGRDLIKEMSRGWAGDWLLICTVVSFCLNLWAIITVFINMTGFIRGLLELLDIMDVLVEANAVVILGSPLVCSAVMLKGLNYTHTSEPQAGQCDVSCFEHEFFKKENWLSFYVFCLAVAACLLNTHTMSLASWACCQRWFITEICDFFFFECMSDKVLQMRVN